MKQISKRKLRRKRTFGEFLGKRLVKKQSSVIRSKLHHFNTQKHYTSHIYVFEECFHSQTSSSPSSSACTNPHQLKRACSDCKTFSNLSLMLNWYLIVVASKADPNIQTRMGRVIWGSNYSNNLSRCRGRNAPLKDSGAEPPI